MAKERARIKGGEVTSVEVGPAWIYVTLRFPTKKVVERGLKRNPQTAEAMRKKKKRQTEPEVSNG